MNTLYIIAVSLLICAAGIAIPCLIDAHITRKIRAGGDPFVDPDYMPYYGKEQVQ